MDVVDSLEGLLHFGPLFEGDLVADLPDVFLDGVDYWLLFELVKEV